MTTFLGDQRNIEEALENVRISTERKMKYQTYIRSDEWKKLRKAIIKRCRNRCEKCGKFGVADIHHLTYERIGHERLEDLMALCRPCHEEIHRISGRVPRSIPIGVMGVKQNEQS